MYHEKAPGQVGLDCDQAVVDPQPAAALGVAGAVVSAVSAVRLSAAVSSP